MSNFIFGPEHIGQDVIRLPHNVRGTVKRIKSDESKTYRLGIRFFYEFANVRYYWPITYFTIDGKNDPMDENVEIFLTNQS